MVMAEYSSRPRTPIKVGFYDIIRTIGRGNFAVVKLARHRITKTEVAIKIIDKLRLDQLNLKKIYREIQILKLLNHQHIIKLYQVMETSSTIYLVCEYARNGELFDYITEQGHLPEDKARKMFWQVLTAVEYCHKNNVVHRDLKAENLLLDKNNNIKLADFGFSNFYQSGNMLSTWCGSPPYAAPEVFEGKVYEGPQLDVWSLGVVLYVLVCGTFPFDGSNLATLKERVLGGRFRIPYWMSQDCESLVRRMLVINPKKRLTISQIKKHKWMQAQIPNTTLTQTKSSPLVPRRGKLSEYNEHVLKIIQGLGINYQKTVESLNLSAYDHLYAIYHLLADRLKLHRTSFPPDTNASLTNDCRRPSNVADQAIAVMSTRPNMLHAYSEYKKNSFSSNQTRITNASSKDLKFDDMTSGLPSIQRSLAQPLRNLSPPLPQIRTTMYEDDIKTETDHTTGHCENVLDMSMQQSNFPSDLKYRAHNLQHREAGLGNYNLQRRRHTLMVPIPSQMHHLKTNLEPGSDQETPTLSPHSSTVKLSRSGDEMSVNQGFTMFRDPSDSGISDENKIFGNANEGIEGNFSTNRSKLLHPLQNPHLGLIEQPRSGISPIANAMGEPMVLNEDLGLGQTESSQRVTQIVSQRRLDTSPIGFREGRRASDGLLMLGNSHLKEHLQKLARAKAVPEMTQEDSEECWETEAQTKNSNWLQVPKQVDRCSSGERIVPLTANCPIGSGGNISFQPYNNNQSLARRRSLQVQLLQNRVNSSSHQIEPRNASPTSVSPQQSISFNQPGPQAVFNHTSEAESSCQWSSWKKAPSSTYIEGNPDTAATRQVSPSAVSNKTWQEGDQKYNLCTLYVASDESVPSKAAAAQRDSLAKPIRQQSLPITPTSTGHPFGTTAGQHQSLAQVLQQRRLQRRLKVATHQHQTPGYQLPLPELEQLRIDSNEALGQLQQLTNHFRVSGSLPTHPVPYLPDTEWGTKLDERFLQFGTFLKTDENACYDSEIITAIPEQFPGQEIPTYQSHRNYVECKKHHSPSYCGSPVQEMVSNTLPIMMADGFVSSQLSWSYESGFNCENQINFSKYDCCATERVTSPTPVFSNDENETMEFARY